MEKNNQLIVIKIGTTSLTEADAGISPKKVKRLVSQIGDIKKAGHQVIVVTSGAIAAGFQRLGYQERPTTVAAKQAAAAVGQGLLIEEYTKYLYALGYVGAQLLVNRTDFTDKRRYQNAFNTLMTLLKKNAVPIINENDTVSIEELKFGDNDTLSAHVAALIHADLLILLTDVDGLYTSDPHRDSTARRLETIEHIGADIEDMARSTAGKTGTGGMRSKISAAKLATASGVPVFICSSADDGILLKAVKGEADGTYFMAQPHNMNTKMQWLAFHSDVKGTVVIDDGAVTALRDRHTSLLPSGITEVRGDFSEGDVVEVVDEEYNYVGKGVTQYDNKSLNKILGLSTCEIQRILPGAKPEAINRDNWLGTEKIDGGI